jgi:hypothetical protein
MDFVEKCNKERHVKRLSGVLKVKPSLKSRYLHSAQLDLDHLSFSYPGQ